MPCRLVGLEMVPLLELNLEGLEHLWLEIQKLGNVNQNKCQLENTLLWIWRESNSSWLANEKRPGSHITLRMQTKSYPDWYWILYSFEPWVPDWVVSCKTYTWEYKLSRIRIDIGYGIRVNLEFLYWVVPGLVLFLKYL